MNRIDLDARLRPPMVPPGPLAHAEMQILDRHQRPVPVGVIGELYVGGPCVARCYLNRPDLTAERFVPDPSGAGRLYRTGDLVRHLPDGKVEFLGRADNQVKIRGFRIELGEIEAALASLSGVREAVVTAHEDRSAGGSGDWSLAAYIATDDLSGITGETLRQALRERLPDYMIPAAFVMLSEMPLLSSGKVNRRALPAPEWQSTETGYVAPRTPVEEVVAGIWAEVLRIEWVGVNSHFFDLGGHSLLAVQVMARIEHVQPEGPWLLVGWSSGALTAYEMAQQIESTGGRSLLAMFDPPPPLERRSVQEDDTSLLVAFARLWRPSEEGMASIRETLVGLDVEDGLDRLLDLARSAGVLPPSVGKPWLRERYDLFRRSMKTVESYLPRPYGGRVTLFRAGASLAPGATDLTSGWNQLARTEAHLIPDADHFSLLQRPALDDLVEHLESAFAAAEGSA